MITRASCPDTAPSKPRSSNGHIHPSRIVNRASLSPGAPFADPAAGRAPRNGPGTMRRCIFDRGDGLLADHEAAFGQHVNADARRRMRVRQPVVNTAEPL